MKRIALFFILVISGCNTTPRPNFIEFWKKDGVSYDTAYSAHADCSYNVGMAKFDTPLEKKEMVKACMLKDGFRWGYYKES